MLFCGGEKVESMFRISHGRVRLERCLADGRVVMVDTARAGALVAESSLFVDRYRCDAVAEVRTSVEVEGRSELLQRLLADPETLLQLCQRLSSQLREARLLLEIRNIRPARQRLLEYLEMRSAAGQPPEGRPVRLIAEQLGLAPETLYRLLADLEDAGEIARHGRSIRLRDPD
jgi:CRP-like cAMP-binding protein